MELVIDTSDKTFVAIRDRKGEVIDGVTVDLRFSQSEKLLKVIDDLLDRTKICKSSLTGICVNAGPGSYTGIRVGVSTANFLAFSLNIPISEMNEDYKGLGNDFGVPVRARYLRPPFITSKKPRRA